MLGGMRREFGGELFYSDFVFETKYNGFQLHLFGVHAFGLSI